MARRFFGLLPAVVGVAVTLLASDASAGPIGICVGNCGTLGADGDVTAPPGGGTYDFVSTFQAPASTGLGLFGNEINGSTLTSPLFSASGSDQLAFYFNYVTSDGAGFPEYAWAQLLPEGGSPILLFTARTCETTPCDTVPGVGMPPLGAGVSLAPPSTPIIANETEWSPLGPWSGLCFDVGCGNTGWIQMLYTPTGGNYMLQIGVVNVNDEQYDSGLAIAGATIGGQPIGDGDEVPVPVPEPTTLFLLGGGLVSLAARSRSRHRQS